MSDSDVSDRPTGAGITRRRLLAGAAAAGASAVLSACGNSGSLPVGRVPRAVGRQALRARVTLSYWNGFTGGDGPVMQQLVEQFNASQRDVHVVMNSIRWDDYYRKVPVAVASGRGPDLGVMQQHQLPSNAARGVVVALDQLAASHGLKEQDFFPTAWRGGVFQGKRYGIPLDVHPLGMYYNKAAFKKAGIKQPPATHDEFDEALARLKKSGFAQPFWMPTLWPAHFMFEALVWQYGGSPFSPNGSRVTIASDAGRKALEWMTSMYRRGYSPTAVAQDSQFNAFANGTNAITWDGIWMVLAVADVPGGAGIAPLPQIGTQKATWANSHNLVVFNRPSLDPVKVEACMLFIEWLSQHSLDWAKAGQVPARNSVRESQDFAKLGPQATFAKELPYARLVPVGPGIGDIQDDTILNAVDSALRSNDPASALRYQEKICNDELRLTRDQYLRG